MSNKYHFDAIERIDSNLNAFFSKQLEQIRKQLFEKKYPELRARNWVPVKTDINPGAEVYTYQSVAEVGEAEFVTDWADDAPLSEIAGNSEDTHKMRALQLGYAWHVQEARAAQFAGQDLPNRKAMACRRGIERFIDKNLLLGGTTGGVAFQGLFTLSGDQAPITYTPANLTWEDETPDEIIADLCGMDTKVWTDSKEIERCDSVIFPSTTLEMLTTRRMGDSANVSILDHFLGLRKHIKNVDSSIHLEASAGHGGGANKRVVMYNKDPEKLEGLVNEFEQFQPEFRGMRVITTCMARVGGVAAYYPKSVVYADGV